MENFSFGKINKKPDAEQLKINFEEQSESSEQKINEEESKENKNGHISTEYDFEVLEEAEEKGDIEKIDSKNEEDESYVDLKDLDIKDDPGWDLYGRFNEIKNKKIEDSLKNKNNSPENLSNEQRIKRAFNRDNLK